MAYSNTGEDYDQYGFDCKFVTEPPPKFICSICVMILRDPYQTQCCGAHYCQCCVQQLVNKKTPCVTCGGVVRAFRDVSVTQKINSLLVRCTHVDWGCDWTGELGQLGEHVVSCDSKPAKCNSCGLFVPKAVFRDHESLDCPKRPHTCTHCRNFTSTFEEVRDTHWPQCPRFPIDCPNGCSTTKKIEREKMMYHLKNECNMKERLADMTDTIAVLEVELQEKEQRILVLEAELQESGSKKDGDKSLKKTPTKGLFRRKNSKPYEDVISKDTLAEPVQRSQPHDYEDSRGFVDSGGKERNFVQEVTVLKECIAEKVKIIEELRERNSEQCKNVARMEEDFKSQLQALQSMCKKLSDEKEELEKRVLQQEKRNSTSELEEKFSQLI